MTKEENWVDRCIKKAQENSPIVTERVVDLMKEQLNGSLGERPLRHTELKTSAGELLLDMVPSPTTKPGNSHED